MTVADYEAAHGRHMARERELELSTSEIPDLDRSISRTRGKPLIGWIDGHRAHPSLVTADDTIKAC